MCTKDGEKIGEERSIGRHVCGRSDEVKGKKRVLREAVIRQCVKVLFRNSAVEIRSDSQW